MLTARKYRNRASKPVILSIGSRAEGQCIRSPGSVEIGHGFKPSSFMFLRRTFAFRRRERSGDGPKFRIHLPQAVSQTDWDGAELLSGAVRCSFKARNGKFESTSLQNAAWRGKRPVRSTPPRRRRKRRYPIGASRLSCCRCPGVGNGKHRPPSSPLLPPQGGASGPDAYAREPVRMRE
jgi:hypothetical protein